MNDVVSLTPEKIHLAISEQIAGGVPYIDALINYAEKNNLEIESVAAVIKKSSILKEKIRSEAVLLILTAGLAQGTRPSCTGLRV